MEILMKTYIAPRHSITITAPSGGVTSGQGVLIGTLFGIAQADSAEGTEAEILTEGVVEIGKTSALGSTSTTISARTRR
jgi:predicted RecA/RadA family phage recombinase